MRDTNLYSITSTYKMKLTGDLKALETSINIYRDSLRMLIHPSAKSAPWIWV